MENSEKKIHVDEDWKEQVAREKQAAQARHGGPIDSGSGSSGETAATEETTRQHAAEITGEEQPFGEPAGEATHPEFEDYPLPAPSLSFLITTIGTQAMVALGEVPNPFTGKLERRPNQAKHFIDTLAMIEEKTAGNRTTEESAMLTSLLHQLRMAYVAGGP
jgi:hypothetical protein